MSSSTFWFYVMGAVLLAGIPLTLRLMSRHELEAREQPSGAIDARRSEKRTDEAYRATTAMTMASESGAVFRSQSERAAWLAAVIVAYGSLFVGMATFIEFTPVPLRFPEASDAFLYMKPNSGIGVAVLAIPPLVTGLVFWSRASRPHRDDEESGIRGTPRKRVLACLGIGIVMAASGILGLWRDNATYSAALTERGFVEREYWTGRVKAEPWSALHHVELSCDHDRSVVGYGRYSVPPRPGVFPQAYLRFRTHHSVPQLLDMAPFRMTQAQAFAKVEESRRRNQAPVVWRSSEQAEAFRIGSGPLSGCVNEFVNYFPAESRNALLTMLRTGPEFREQVLASYR